MEQIIENQLIIFKLGDEEFGININEVREIITVPEITKIPNTDEYIMGIINLRENIIVVLDLEKKLKLLPSMETKEKRIIIVELEGESVGMMVDSCNQVLRIDGDQIDDAPTTITNKIGGDYLKGVGKVDGRLIILLNLLNLFGDKVIQDIKKMGDSEKPPVSEAETVEVEIEKDPAKVEQETPIETKTAEK